eukprot:21128_4
MMTSHGRCTRRSQRQKISTSLWESLSVRLPSCRGRLTTLPPRSTTWKHTSQALAPSGSWCRAPTAPTTKQGVSRLAMARAPAVRSWQALSTPSR